MLRAPLPEERPRCGTRAPCPLLAERTRPLSGSPSAAPPRLSSSLRSEVLGLGAIPHGRYQSAAWSRRLPCRPALTAPATHLPAASCSAGWGWPVPRQPPGLLPGAAVQVTAPPPRPAQTAGATSRSAPCGATRPQVLRQAHRLSRWFEIRAATRPACGRKAPCPRVSAPARGPAVLSCEEPAVTACPLCPR